MKKIALAFAGITTALVGAAATPAHAATTTTWTTTLYCIDSAHDFAFQPINDVNVRTIRGAGVTATDTLTDPATGTTATFNSKYRMHSDEFGESWWAGPRILDNGEIAGGIYYLTGNAKLFFSGGGYTASFQAKNIVDVCATTFGYVN